VYWLSLSLSNLWVSSSFLGLLEIFKVRNFLGIHSKLCPTLTLLNQKEIWLDFGLMQNPLPSNFGA